MCIAVNNLSHEELKSFAIHFRPGDKRNKVEELRTYITALKKACYPDGGMYLH
jgi:hypothetical protein